MRELCKIGSGKVVAAVVAVLEKNSSLNYENKTKQNIGNVQFSSKKIQVSDDTRDSFSRCSQIETSSINSKEQSIRNSTTNLETADFENAVKDFDSVAEDVQKFVAQTKTNSLKRKTKTNFEVGRSSSLRDRIPEEVTKSGDNSLGRHSFSGNSSNKEGTFEVLTDSLSGSKTFKRNFRKEAFLLNENTGVKLESGKEPARTIYSQQIGECEDLQDDYLNKLKCSDTNCVKRNSSSGTDSSGVEDELVSSSGGSASVSGGDDSDSEREHVINEGLETITEEDRLTASSRQSFSKDNDENDSTQEEESTLKEHDQGWSDTGSENGSSSTTSSERPHTLRDSSTRCNSDFQWIRKDLPKSPRSPRPASPNMDEPTLSPPVTTAKPPINRTAIPSREKFVRREKAPGSLDRRRHTPPSRQERDLKTRSTHVKSPPRLEDFQPCHNWCCNPPEYFDYHRHQDRPIESHHYGSSPMLMERKGSHPDLYGDGGGGRFRHDMMGCCSYHVTPPPPCCFYGDRGYRWTPPPFSKPSEQDERLRKIQYEKDNLQLQVQVLTEQIEAQSDKISDLEKILHDKKQMLSDSENKLQREVLSRSSLETQKLELMTIISELKLQQAALERENKELRNSHYNNNGDLKKPPLISRLSPQPQLTSTPVHQNSSQTLGLRMSPSPSPVNMAGTNMVKRSESNCIPEIQQPKTPPAHYKRQVDIHYGSLPRQQFLGNGSMSMSLIDTNANPSANGGRKGVAFAQTDKIILDENGDAPQLQFKGIKKIFGKIKRSGSGNLDDIPGAAEFKRGGVRATAAARLGWSEPPLMQKPDKPFAEWDTENICDWLQDLGLDQYVPEAKRWVKTGQHLLESSISEIEKELNIKNSLHRKKLQLALVDTEINGCSDPYLKQAGELDTAWVLRWLDDTGLPQHKESFLINRVDGRVLHRLTVDELGLLHVTSLLHVASIKRGIQVLRENGYEPGCLQRRSLPNDISPPTSKQVSLWTTHRVMEWLRAVDLAEYAPNLRGAGVHGALMVFEPKFTAELLASLLSIPPGKTLLRRHLNTHFKELLGKDIIQVKREAESTLGYIPLIPSAKLKIPKKSQFSLKRKKSKGEADYGDLVCPLNPDKNSGELNGSALNSSLGMTRIKESLEEEDVSLHAEKTVRSLPASISSSPVPLRH